MTTFDPIDQATWPPVLTAEQIAAIYQRKILGLKKSCQQNRFLPAPYRTHPYRWRKVDVVRDVEGARMVPVSRLRRAS